MSWDFSALFASGCWSEPNMMMYPLLFLFLFSFNITILNKLDNSMINIGIIYLYITSAYFVSKSFEPDMKVKAFYKTVFLL